MDFQEYRTWIKQFLKDGEIVSSEVTQFSKEIFKLNSQATSETDPYPICNSLGCLMVSPFTRDGRYGLLLQPETFLHPSVSGQAALRDR